MRVVLDAECNGLLPTADKIWVVCCVDVDTGEMQSFRTRGELIKAAKDWTAIITFNGLGYDFWMLWKAWGIPFTTDSFNDKPIEHIDVLVWSRTLNPDRSPKHSLAWWGDQLGFKKTEWDDWSEYSEEMEAYCFNDCLLTAKVYRELLREKGQ